MRAPISTVVLPRISALNIYCARYENILNVTEGRNYEITITDNDSKEYEFKTYSLPLKIIKENLESLMEKTSVIYA